MATQTAHSVALDSALPHDADAAEPPVGARLVSWFKQACCALHGHDNLMHFEKDRVYLQCATCGHETPGWTLPEASPRLVFTGDARRHAMARPRLVSARRIA